MADRENLGAFDFGPAPNSSTSASDPEGEEARSRWPNFKLGGERGGERGGVASPHKPRVGVKGGLGPSTFPPFVTELDETLRMLPGRCSYAAAASTSPVLGDLGTAGLNDARLLVDLLDARLLGRETSVGGKTMGGASTGLSMDSTRNDFVP